MITVAYLNSLLSSTLDWSPAHTILQSYGWLQASVEAADIAQPMAMGRQIVARDPALQWQVGGDPGAYVLYVGPRSFDPDFVPDPTAAGGYIASCQFCGARQAMDALDCTMCCEECRRKHGLKPIASKQAMINRCHEPGWRRIGRIDAVGRRSLWIRQSLNCIELCAGREGDDAYVRITPDNQQWRDLHGVLSAARFAAEYEDDDGLALDREAAERGEPTDDSREDLLRGRKRTCLDCGQEYAILDGHECFGDRS